MKKLYVSALLLSIFVLIVIILSVLLHTKLQIYTDKYGNTASILGLFISIIGFGLTVWTILAAVRANADAQEKIQLANESAQENIKKLVNESRREMTAILAKIRYRSMEESHNQAYAFANEARHSIRNNSWIRAAERCEDSRKQAQILLGFQDLEVSEKATLRSIVEDLKTVVVFIERNRIRSNGSTKFPQDKIAPLDSLVDVLLAIKSRWNQNILGATDVDDRE